MADGTIILEMTYFGQQVRNVLAFSNVLETAEWRGDFLAAMALTWQFGDPTAPIANLVSAWQLNGIRFQYDGNPEVQSWGISVPYQTPIAGTTATTAGVTQGTQIAMLISTQSVGPPPNRGRIYLAGMPSTAIGTTGFFLEANRAPFVNMVESWASDGVAGAFLRIARRNPQGYITASNGVDAVIGRSVPAVQRRRRIGQGI